MFKDKLKELREKAGLSQEQLASIIYVSRSAIAKWESGNGVPSDVNLKAICDYFCVEEDYLLDREDLKEAISDLDQKQVNLKKIFFSSIVFIILFCLIVGGPYYILHRIAILLTLAYFIIKCFMANNKLNKAICIVFLVMSIIISIINWLIMAIPEPSHLFRIFTSMKKMNINGMNIVLSQLSSILNISMYLAYSILFIIYNKTNAKKK